MENSKIQIEIQNTNRNPKSGIIPVLSGNFKNANRNPKYKSKSKTLHNFSSEWKIQKYKYKSKIQIEIQKSYETDQKLCVS